MELIDPFFLPPVLVPAANLFLNKAIDTRIFMHYYQFNIGDYIANTARLSNLEDLCYRRLLDLYYLNERPFNECSNSVAREIGMVEQIEIVEFILNKYFQLNDGFWHQKRADHEILLYQNKLKSASKAGKASAKARQLKASERPLNDRSPSVELNIKHKPLNNNHNKEIKRKTFSKPIPDEINKFAFSEKLNLEGFFNFYESNGWKVGKNKMKDWKAAARGWSKRQDSYSNKSDQDFSDTSTDWVNQDHRIII